ncbi:HAD-IB family hydrolase [Brachybacterium huguangmaarense]
MTSTPATPSTESPDGTSAAKAMQAVAAAAPRADQQILLTGVTGFLGQAVLQSLLENFPRVRVTVLVRPKGTQTGRKRLEGLLRKPVFTSWADRSSAEAVKAAFDERVDVLEGDLTDMPAIEQRIDTVIHSASSVSFDPPIDEAFRTNVGGARNLYEALLASGQDPHVIHVSTAYVGGISKGVRQEGALTHSVDWRAEHDAALAARERVEAESRKPETLRSQMLAARVRDGKMGPKAVAAAAEDLRTTWVHDRLVDYGRTRAQSVGWTDIYTFTKAMAERVAEDLWAGTGHRLSVVRPSIIESAVRRPYPGWIDGYKVADPLIMAYGRGMLPEFPGLADSILDIIPVDFVVNVIVALATQEVERRGDDAYFQVVSGQTNPLPFHEMVTAVRGYFVENPLEGEDGEPIIVPEWDFPAVEMVDVRFRLKEIATRAGQLAVSRLPATRRTREWTTQLHRNASGLETLRKYTELYRQYTKTEMVFDDANTRALRTELPEGFLAGGTSADGVAGAVEGVDRASLDFDIAGLDWLAYFRELHLPAVTELTKAYSRRKATLDKRANRAAPPMTEGSDILAVFDLDGTVISANVVQQYVSVMRASRPKAAWPAEIGNLLGALPGYLRAEHRDRSEFIRAVNRRYKGFREAEVRELMSGDLGRRIRASIRPEALEVIERHRAAGHRTVLVTGALDVLVQPLAELFDEVVATHMDVDADGVMTGFLATPPLVDEARANWLRKYAGRVGASLQKSYGYGDSLPDAAWLELVGTPAAVSPDLGLYSIAKKKRWAILEW